MVSNTLKMDQKKLIKELARIRKVYADDPDYQKLRKDLPKDWPL
jgi:hypothetical protein